MTPAVRTCRLVLVGCVVIVIGLIILAIYAPNRPRGPIHLRDVTARNPGEIATRMSVAWRHAHDGGVIGEGRPDPPAPVDDQAAAGAGAHVGLTRQGMRDRRAEPGY